MSTYFDPYKQEQHMKPFNLEAAARGEPICITAGVNCKFIGVDSKGWIVVEDADGDFDSFVQSDLAMAPKKRTVWVNFHTNPARAYYYNTSEEADDYQMHCRIGGKAYPVEIEE